MSSSHPPKIILPTPSSKLINLRKSGPSPPFLGIVNTSLSESNWGALLSFCMRLSRIAYQAIRAGSGVPLRQNSSTASSAPSKHIAWISLGVAQLGTARNLASRRARFWRGGINAAISAMEPHWYGGSWSWMLPVFVVRSAPKTFFIWASISWRSVSRVGGMGRGLTDRAVLFARSLASSQARLESPYSKAMSRSFASASLCTRRASLQALTTSRSARKTGTIDLQILNSLSMKGWDDLADAINGMCCLITCCRRCMAVQASAVIHPARVISVCWPKCFVAVERIIAATSSYQWCNDRVGGRTKRSALAEKASSIVLKKDRCIVSSASAQRIACLFHLSEGGPVYQKSICCTAGRMQALGGDPSWSSIARTYLQSGRLQPWCSGVFRLPRLQSQYDGHLGCVAYDKWELLLSTCSQEPSLLAHKSRPVVSHSER